jgi:DNA invertase Pin-like site-specific DNA recombinase
VTKELCVTTHPTTTSHPSSAYRTPTIRGKPGADRVAVAFLARVSTDDQQDPTLSLPRQLANCQAALPDGWEITAWFWDIESGRMALELRGRGHAHEHIDVPLPRDGGLTDLLAEAEHPRRRFDAVICESIDRLARRTYIGTRIEHDLEQAGVRLYAADEPIDPRGKRSTGLLTRRVKQGVAEWYVTDMLERAATASKSTPARVGTSASHRTATPPTRSTTRCRPRPPKARPKPASSPTRNGRRWWRTSSDSASSSGSATTPSPPASTPTPTATPSPNPPAHAGGAAPGPARPCATS